MAKNQQIFRTKESNLFVENFNYTLISRFNDYQASKTIDDQNIPGNTSNEIHNENYTLLTIPAAVEGSVFIKLILENIKDIIKTHFTTDFTPIVKFESKNSIYITYFDGVNENEIIRYNLDEFFAETTADNQEVTASSGSTISASTDNGTNSGADTSLIELSKGYKILVLEDVGVTKEKEFIFMPLETGEIRIKLNMILNSESVEASAYGYVKDDISGTIQVIREDY